MKNTEMNFVVIACAVLTALTSLIGTPILANHVDLNTYKVVWFSCGLAGAILTFLIPRIIGARSRKRQLINRLIEILICIILVVFGTIPLLFWFYIVIAAAVISVIETRRKRICLEI